MREKIHAVFHASDPDMRRSGVAAGTCWRFLREMNLGDWVVVPHRNSTFYVAEITGNPVCDTSPKALANDAAYRRSVRWLNGKKPIKRGLARARLISRLKIQGTSASATDIIPEIAAVLQLAAQGSGSEQLFAEALRLEMVKSVRRQIEEGHMSERKFEELVCQVLLGVGASSAKIIPRRKDKGVDIVAQFAVGLIDQIGVGVQARYYRGRCNSGEFVDLIRGMEEEGVARGWFVTSGDFAEDAEEALRQQLEGKNLEIQLVDGETFAGLIVDAGLKNIL